jgi:putative chitinase
MKAIEITGYDVLEEGPMWDLVKKHAKGAAVAGGLVGAAASQLGDKPTTTNVPNFDKPAITRTVDEPTKQDDFKKQYEPKIKSTSQTANQKVQDRLMVTAMSAGIEGEELAAFMAQMAHETLSFTSFEEKGSDAYFKKMYDIKGSDPEKAKLLGNLKSGDGARYKGRGYIHLTGKDNYEKAQKATGHPLVKKPELAADPQVAADVAVWFWNTRIKPNVSDWGDTKSVTRRINPSLKGLQDRDANFYDYKKKLKI